VAKSEAVAPASLLAIRYSRVRFRAADHPTSSLRLILFWAASASSASSQAATSTG
jgi:hypothetical protein